MNVPPTIKPKMPPSELSKDTKNNGIKSLQSQVNRQRNREEK